MTAKEIADGQQSIYWHQRLELLKLARWFLWRYAAKTVAPVLRGAFHGHRSQRHFLQTPGENYFQEVARGNAGRFSVRHQRPPLCHAQQEADRCRRIRDSLSGRRFAARQSTRRCDLAASRLVEKGHEAAQPICENPAPLENHKARDRVSPQIMVR